MKKILLIILLLAWAIDCFCWGFFAHQKINFQAVFLLPPDMMVFYKPNIAFLRQHAVDPDKRRYSVQAEAPRHYLDIDHYGIYPFKDLPRKWEEAVKKFSEDTLRAYGIVVWWIPVMKQRLTRAFREKDAARILHLSAELGHYLADAHVPLHVCSNHNGQLTGQQGIHAFWESRIPELLANDRWDFFVGKAEYISNPQQYIWQRLLESAAAADSVLRFERKLSRHYPDDQKYAFENRNGQVIKQYSSAYALSYDQLLNNMIERRMRQSIQAVASFWYTAWVDAGQPDLKNLGTISYSADEVKALDSLNTQWLKNKPAGFDCDP